MSENAQKSITIFQIFVHYFLNEWYNASTIKF
jgi:hypothetical protein